MTGRVDLDRLQEPSRLRWFDHVHRRKKIMRLKQQNIAVPRKRPAGTSKNHKIDCVRPQKL